jgi:hypothetical protein
MVNRTEMPPPDARRGHLQGGWCPAAVPGCGEPGFSCGAVSGEGPRRRLYWALPPRDICNVHDIGSVRAARIVPEDLASCTHSSQLPVLRLRNIPHSDSRTLARANRREALGLLPAHERERCEAWTTKPPQPATVRHRRHATVTESLIGWRRRRAQEVTDDPDDPTFTRRRLNTALSMWISPSTGIRIRVDSQLSPPVVTRRPPRYTFSRHTSLRPPSPVAPSERNGSPSLGGSYGVGMATR